ncbi:MAG: AMP-binding protein [Myxococcota bacterium]
MWQLRPIPEALRKRYLADGDWTDDTFDSFLEREIASQPQLSCRVWSDVRPFEGRTRDLWVQGLRLAASLEAMGVEQGDVVAFQAPNWAEAIVTVCAGFRLGCVMVPIVHFYGAKEVEFILRQCGARVYITVDRHGHVSHLENLASFRDNLDALEHVLVIQTGETTPEVRGAKVFSSLLDAAPLEKRRAIDPDSAAMIGYTSGTTADPKGVIHTHRSLLFETRQLAALDRTPKPVFSASPIAHMTGMLASFLLPTIRHLPILLTDRWDPELALRVIIDQDVSSGAGATVFLTSLLESPNFTAEHAKRIRIAGLGGAPVPAAVGERAEAAGIKIFRSYGSTEHPSITGSHSDDPFEKRALTDGRPMSGVEIRLVDPDGDGGSHGSEVEPGVPGEIFSRGPDLCAGYTDARLTEKAFDAEGWYRTGDVAIGDEDGFITISDRVSDIIIRGGQNISAAEIEEALMTMPIVSECAVVAAPDDRLGERALAAIRLRPDAEAPSLESVQQHLSEAGLPKQKWVESLRFLEDFPRTPSGKIRKVDLRNTLREG